jgi:small conductance mechanosensitive channel
MRFQLTEATGAVQDMVNSFVERLPYIAVAFVVFVLFYLLALAVRGGARAFARRKQRRHNLGLVLGRLAYGGMMFLGLLTALVIAIPGFTPGQLVSILGLSSVAIGFAFRDILQNFLAGILLLLSEPFRIGDQIVVNGFEGTVEEIQTRATFMRTYDGRRVVIPNVFVSQDAVLQRVVGALRAAGIDLPFPTQHVLLHDQTDEFDGDRSRQREGWPAATEGDSPRPSRIVDALRSVADTRRQPAHESARPNRQ